MRNQPAFRLNRQALIAALISAAFPIASHAAAAGRVEFAIGNVSALGVDGRERPLTKGGEINSGDTIQTADGRTQIKFTDGGYMSLQPNTQFKVDDYAYDGKSDGSEKGFFKLVKGGLRAITGAIGHTNKATYRINTPVATIGIRGTELTGEYSEQGDQKQLKIHVIHGSVYIENEAGELILFQGQNGVVTGEGGKPAYGDGEPAVTAAGPDGGNPQENEEQQQQEQEQAYIFTVAEEYDDDGTPVALGGALAAIQGYAGANAEGVYFLDDNGSITGIANSSVGSGGAAGATGKVTSGVILADFGAYQVMAELDVKVTLPSSDDYTGSFSASGGITGIGLTLAGTGSLSGYSGSLCSGSCQLQATGLFFGPTAQNIGLGYNINGFDGGVISGGNVKGTAGFHAPNTPAPGAITVYYDSL